MIKMLVALTLAVALFGCGLEPMTEAIAERDPDTGEITDFRFRRQWQSGPVYAKIIKKLNGDVEFIWESDVDLDPAVKAEEIRSLKLEMAINELRELTNAVGTMYLKQLQQNTEPIQ